MANTVGIDLGTTNSLIAVMGDDGPELIANSLGELLTPSIVAIDQDGALLVGRAAKELQVRFPDRCASIFKRFMGSDWTTKIAGKSFSAKELSSLVLRSLKSDAEAKLGHPVVDAVITVPAYFNERQRTDTIEAGKLAGLNVRRIINEPTAAAIAYGLREHASERILTVVDLGGGTFDVSVVEQFEGVLEIRASAGEVFLGGEDFTTALVSQVLQTQGFSLETDELRHPLRVSRLRHECEQAKRKLTSQPSATVRVPDAQGNYTDAAPRVEVTRQQFDEWTERVLQKIEGPLRRAMGDAGLNRTQIDEVILVGGATRMPNVVARVTEWFGKAPLSRINPDEVVALGAAVQGGLVDRNAQVDDLVVTDVAPFTMGIEISQELGGRTRPGYFSPVINRNTTIPCSRVESFGTITANQTTVRLKVYQGESRRVEGNFLLGELSVEGIPHGPARTVVDVRFTYDLNGVLEVESTIQETGKKQTLVITRNSSGLNEKQIAEAVRAMQAMKLHPRDEAVNRYLLRRAERVYQELPLSERHYLADLLHGYEDAMESGDIEVIARYQAEVQEFLNRVDPNGGESGAGE